MALTGKNPLKWRTVTSNRQNHLWHHNRFSQFFRQRTVKKVPLALLDPFVVNGLSYKTLKIPVLVETVNFCM